MRGVYALLFVLCLFKFTVKASLPQGSPPKDDDGIITLTNVFWNDVVNSPEHDVVVEFYSPSCIYCVRFEPIWKEVAGHFKNEDTILITKIDASKPDGLIPDIEVTGVPTIMIFQAADKKPVMYYGFRTTSLIVEWILEKAHLPVEVEISYKSQPIPGPSDGAVTEVVGLTWKSIVLNPNNDVFVNFYAPWCPYSNMLQPTWKTLGERLKGVPTVTIAQFDGTANEVPGLHLHAYPTIAVYRAGDNQRAEYKGFTRTEDALLQFLQTEARIAFTDPKTGKLSHEVQPNEKDHAVDVPELDDNSFESVTQKKDKNIVVLFYAPWCEHSQELFATWEEVFRDFKAITTVAIYQMDATKHKIANVDIYPTVKIWPATESDSKDREGITFKGKEPNSRHLKEFIQQNAVRPSIEEKLHEAHNEALKRGLPPPTEEELEKQHGIDFPEIDYSIGQSLIYKPKEDL